MTALHSSRGTGCTKRAGRFWRVSIVLAITSLMPARVALADGGILWVETFLGQARSGGQQAIVLYFDDRETLVLQTDYEGELAEFSWLIPVPSPATANDVHEADADVFPWLDERTAPTFYSLESTGGGCWGAHSGSDASFGGRDQVAVLDTILTDTYEINVLAASEARDLLDWLDTNDYSYPAGAEAVLADYLQRGWYFLAVRVRPSRQGVEVRQALAPLQIGFETDEPVFPLLISSVSSDPETEILIHFLSDHRYETSNVPSEQVYYTGAAEPSGPVDGYRNWMKEQVADRNGRLYFVEYADWLLHEDCLTLNGYLEDDPVDCREYAFVTRFRSYFSPDLFTDDIRFEQSAHDGTFSVVIDVWDSSFSTSSRYLGCLLFLTAALVVRRKTASNSGAHLSRFGFLMAFLVLIA